MATLKQVTVTYKKYRKCPFCKSKKGFKMTYHIGGTGSQTFDFKGNILDSERETFDSNDPTVECLNCHRQIDIERVQIDI
jgi:hypothetical protein